MIRTSLTKPAMDKRWFGWKVGPKGSGKVKMFIEIAKLRVAEGVIFEGNKIKEVLPWENWAINSGF